MLEAKYYKDFRHNYLILKNMDLAVNSYQCRMITENKITGLLQCQERHINGELLLYYEISSKQSLGSFCENGYVTMEFLSRLLHGLQMTREKMAGYLLTESCLLLKPEFVFMDMESGEFFFLYFPFEAEENYMLSFMEYLTERVDVEDQEAVDISYKMLQLLEKEQFVLDEVLQWFEEDYSVPEKGSREIKQEQLDDIEPEEKEDLMEEEEGVLSKRLFSVCEKAVFGVMLLMLCVAGLLLYLYRTYYFSQRGWIYFYAAIVGVLIILISCIGYLVLKKVFADKQEGLLKLAKRTRVYEKDDADRQYQEITAYESFRENPKEEYGNTVFIPWVENCENKLYGSGKGNKHHINLSKLPLTVGKLAGSVDMVISDQSISRRHVKFSREGNKICMTDLNSTNGTFKNGLRLEPNTSEILEPGDEIRLGKLKFIYR